MLLPEHYPRIYERPSGSPKRRLRFSERSTLHKYQEDSVYAATKSITDYDKKYYSEDVLEEATRIRFLVKRTLEAHGGASVDLLEACGVHREEIIGIENLVLGDPSRVLERRRLHVQAVLTEQYKQKKLGERDDDRLARISAILTTIPTTQARTRAAMAA